jgi:hypothetical protein
MLGGSMRRNGRQRRVAVVLAVAAMVVAAGCVPPPPAETVDPLVGTFDPESQLLGCDVSAERLVVTGPSHLDPSCTYTRGVEITASNSTLDCRGARIQLGAGETDNQGILIETPATVPMSDVTVRNCIVDGFQPNNLRIRRQGFKDLVQGTEYDAATSNILVENSQFTNSNGSGVFVDGFVTGVTLRDIEVSGSGGVGIYLEAGSKDNIVENSRIHRNGFRDVVPEGVPIVLNGVELRYESTGREGIAVDGARDSIIRNNWIAGNAAGAIFVYKNCGEDQTTNGHWVRHYGATGNLITENFISSEKNGVWIGSRAAENQAFLDCSDPAYIDVPARRVHLDPASDNTVHANTFLYVNHGVRVEDDAATITDNHFSSYAATDQAILIGTKERTGVLGQPVNNTVITGNRADISGNATPYQWVWGHTGTAYEDNQSSQTDVALTEGVQPTINLFLFAIRIWQP